MRDRAISLCHPICNFEDAADLGGVPSAQEAHPNLATFRAGPSRTHEMDKRGGGAAPFPSSGW